MAGQNATTPRWLNAAEMKAWRRYIIASRRLLEALDLDLASHELSMADYEVLAQLSDAHSWRNKNRPEEVRRRMERKMRMSELADVAMLSRSRLSHRIKVMEKAGWVKREACPEDKRGFFAVMTAKGWKAIVSAAPDHVESVRTRFVDHLTKEDQRVLSEIFERVTQSLKENPPAE